MSVTLTIVRPTGEVVTTVEASDERNGHIKFADLEGLLDRLPHPTRHVGFEAFEIRTDTGERVKASYSFAGKQVLLHGVEDDPEEL